ncbi:MAG: hypothetical protein US50_C0011G0005 [Candidatus Nomurabacteria bacterium GW2011_GWB1_37_5]|uniref:DUF3300 domain-containing protein n=1 Tax=Candidatus Nomurabacteria bacterium GW2011_GWB1_37_5 TaxID=1618742 RepID=A0A0G0H064_9BACT|nr:MAG: hypothetical protein US50_C0011G0005 [Candidatus Nomurabacteria bacterium GW2011_GWB1_37_5]
MKKNILLAILLIMTASAFSQGSRKKGKKVVHDPRYWVSKEKKNPINEELNKYTSPKNRNSKMDNDDGDDVYNAGKPLNKRKSGKEYAFIDVQSCSQPSYYYVATPFTPIWGNPYPYMLPYNWNYGCSNNGWNNYGWNNLNNCNFMGYNGYNNSYNYTPQNSVGVGVQFNYQRRVSADEINENFEAAPSAEEKVPEKRQESKPKTPTNISYQQMMAGDWTPMERPKRSPDPGQANDIEQNYADAFKK